MRSRWSLSFVLSGVLGLSLGAFAACVDASGTTSCQPGTYFCACLNGICQAGLTCENNICLGPDDGETSGSGDGDGDTGDGDGDSGDGDGDTGDGDGDTGGELPNGATCTADSECVSNHCFLVPFLGGQCGECNEDADCPNGGCSWPNPFESNGSMCNTGQAGDGCESDQVCQPGLTCATVVEFLGLITVETCGECAIDADCGGGTICAPIFIPEDWAGQNTCITPGSLPQDSFCNYQGNGDQACQSGICSPVDVMGLGEMGACGECNSDADCSLNQQCVPGEFVLDTGTLIGSTCQ